MHVCSLAFFEAWLLNPIEKHCASDNVIGNFCLPGIRPECIWVCKPLLDIVVVKWQMHMWEPALSNSAFWRQLCLFLNTDLFLLCYFTDLKSVTLVLNRAECHIFPPMQDISVLTGGRFISGNLFPLADASVSSLGQMTISISFLPPHLFPPPQDFFAVFLNCSCY